MYLYCEQNFNMVQVPKTGTRENLILKAGHPPAVKAGGMRVAKKNADDGGLPEEKTKRPEKPRSTTTSSRMQQVSVLLAGTLDKLGHDFPETPVSVRHSKVRPAMEKPHVPRTFFIQQPRKC
ncbi:death-associated protein-like 1 homolog [Alosa pseudoharengus]|uniref:death-associated protein-like 1 homolog n=1 Tax=Alosa pseudoharengus TaxID=34774 RepID=UPI003F8BDDD4